MAVEAKTPDSTARAKVFAALFGSFLGIALLKLGNPPIMQRLVSTPSDGWEWVFGAWPLWVGYGLLAVVLVASFGLWRFTLAVPWWWAAAPAAWLVWQYLSASQTVAGELTRPTVEHFTACVICFYLGLFGLNRPGLTRYFLWPLAVAFALMLREGFDQHFGGLAETRRYFFMYVYPTLHAVPPEYLKKMSSERIFATVFYPNALAGAILLLFPVLVGWIWQSKVQLTQGARGFLVGALGVAAAGCLYWSGSKGGWLLALLLGLVLLLNLDFPKRIKWFMIGAVLVLGLVGFGLKYAGFFQKGATSVVARFDYWHAAGATVKQKPMLGSGPGTFGVAYAAIKRPESEMARLTHNDYLQQASDSGVPGGLLYLVIVGGALVFGWRRIVASREAVQWGVWLGLLGWAVQAFGEFTLYVPSIAWIAFAGMGWLLAATGKRIDKV